MNRPISLIVGAAVAAVLVAAIGASAHTAGPFFSRVTGAQGSHFGDKASGARTESPEPSDSPEASPKAMPKVEPTEKPEASPSAEPTETSDANDGDVEGSPAASSGGEGGIGTGGGGGGD
jgi:hypothetical protein